MYKKFDRSVVTLYAVGTPEDFGWSQPDFYDPRDNSQLKVTLTEAEIRAKIAELQVKLDEMAEREAAKKMREMLASGRVKILIDGVYDYADIDQAYSAFKNFKNLDK